MKKEKIYRALFLTGSFLMCNSAQALIEHFPWGVKITGETLSNNAEYTNSETNEIQVHSLTSSPPGQPGIRGNFVNNSSGTVNNYGTIGTYWVPGYYAGSIANYGEFNNLSDWTGFPSIGRVINNGEFWNQNNATATNSGHWETSFYFDNRGTFTNKSGSFLFENTGTVWNHATFYNQGFLDNSSYFSNADGATMDNSGAFLNSGTLRNYGTLMNSGQVISSGTTKIFSTGTVSGNGTYTQTAGDTIVDGTFEAGTVSIEGGTLSGSGSIIGNVNIGAGAEVNPGNSPGTLIIDGDFLLEASGLLTLEVEGAGAGEFDQLITSGELDLLGEIQISLLFGYTLDNFLAEFNIGDLFRIGTESSNDPAGNLSLFANANLSAIDGTMEAQLRLLSNGTFSDDPSSNGRVPEPAPLALVGLGMAAIGFRRHRSKKAA